MYRALDRDLLGVEIEPPEPFQRPRGFRRTVLAVLGDGPGWRAVLYLLLTLPLSIVSFVVSVSFLAAGLGGITHPARLVLLAVAGVLLLFLWPHAQRLTLLPLRILGPVLLGRTGADPALQALVDGAHRSTKDVLVDLRELARGIRPPALDSGLAVALETLTARSGHHVRLRLHAALDAHHSIETIAHFCAAELVANSVKHALARPS